MKLRSAVFCGFAFLAFNLSAQNSGQNYTTSPYSNFGLGEVLNLNLVQAGAQSQTWTGAYSYSLLNPATLSNLKFTSFDFGLHYTNGLVQSQSEKQSFNGGALNYLSLAFTTWHKDKRWKDSINGKTVWRTRPFAWNSYISLYPNTSVGYNYTLESKSPIHTTTAHSGKGGINTIEFGNGFRMGRHISLGYALGNMFGRISDNSLFSNPDSTNLDIVEDEKVINVRGWQHTFGAMFNFSKDSTYHRIGFSLRTYSGMRGQTQRLTRTLDVSSGSLYISDTVMNTVSSWTKFKMPVTFGVGYYFQYRRAWGIGLDWRKQKWGNYSAFFQPNQKLTDRTDYGFTFTLFPQDEKAPGEKRMKVPVRLGGRYSITQNVLQYNGNKTNINEMSTFVGFGIPLTRRYYDNRVLRSVINIQVDYLQRGKDQPGFAKEQYVMLTLGFNLGDIWFQRKKFD